MPSTNSGEPGFDPRGLVPPAVRAFASRAAAAVRSLSRPVRVLIATTLVAALAGALWLGLRSAYEPYGVLFSQLEREDAGAIAAKLKELRVPFRVSDDGGAIEVPEARVPEVRLSLASAGLPRGGGVGFESFDNIRLGATEFEQRVLYRRAMEGELSRTIGGINAVRSARVHLVLPEKSVFTARREPASASVIVRLRPGRSLGASEVAGVVHLVVAAVPGLTAEHVALVTTDGIALHKPRSASPDGSPGGEGGEEDVARVRVIEGGLEERARALLERIVGPGHVDVRASADVDLARVERTEDRYDPRAAVLRSEEQTVERAAASTDDGVAGVPGTESNLPGAKNAGEDAPAAASAAPAAGALTRESHTRNWEFNHVQEKRVSAGGYVRRLTVAVVVDGVPGPDHHTMVPRDRAELDKLANLVRSAVGADDKRGDLVTVESVPFPDAEPPPAAAPSLLDRVPVKYRRYVYIGAAVIGVVTLVVVLLAVRRAARGIAGLAVAAASSAAPLTISAAPAGAAAASALLRDPDKALELPAPRVSPDRLREDVIRRVKQDPATAALVVQRWLAGEDK